MKKNILILILIFISLLGILFTIVNVANTELNDFYKFGHYSSIEDLEIKNSSLYACGEKKYFSKSTLDGEKHQTFQFNSIVNTIEIKNDKITILGMKNGSIIIFNTARKKKVKKFEAHNKSIICMELDNQNKFLITGSISGEIKIFNLNTLRLRNKIELNSKSYPTSLLTDSKNDRIFISDSIGTLYLLNGDTIKHKKRVHKRSITDMIKVNNNQLCTSSLDKRVKFINIKSFNVEDEIRQNHPVNAIDIDNENNKLASGNSYGQLKVYNLRNKTLEINRKNSYRTNIIFSNRSSIEEIKFGINNEKIFIGDYNGMIRYFSLQN